MALLLASPCHSRACPHRSRRSLSIVAAKNSTCDVQTHQPSLDGINRRKAVLLAPALLTSLAASPALAGVAQDLLKGNIRPDLSPIDAIVQMMDARGVLYEIKALAATPLDSQERRSSNSLLPGYATRLRKVANAAPTVASLIAGTDKEAQVSEMYGGEAGTTSLTDPVFITVGQILNYSGRGLNPDVLGNPAFAQAAIDAVEEMLAMVPQNAMNTATAQREAARAAARR